MNLINHQLSAINCPLINTYLCGMRKYPIGLQNFRKIREEGFLYIDKTEIIHQLITSGNYYFLSRPRRFGKSLLLSTIKEIFSGSKELFQGLWIENNWNWEQKHPIIQLSINQINYQAKGLYKALNDELAIIAHELNIQIVAPELKDRFRELIQKAAQQYGRVVILIDEYDKPIIDNLEHTTSAEEHRAVMKNMYSILKDADPYIRLLLLTGVSRFSKVSIFSDLNNLNDITLHPWYATLTGVTQQELELNFDVELNDIKKTQPDVLAELKNWYNGYSWNNGADKVYNPFSLLKFMEHRQFNNFWFETGTPTFLVQQLKKHKAYDFEQIQAGAEELNSFYIEHIHPTTLLFQTGYLSIKGYDPTGRVYELGYPNLEVKASLLDYLLSAYRYSLPANSTPLAAQIFRAFQSNDIDTVVHTLNTLMASIPYDLWKNASEFYYHTIVHLTLTLVGTYIQSEVHTAKGRCDAIVQTGTHIYALEFKLDKPVDEAIQQIKEKDYLGPYTADKREKVAIGISFSSENRKVEDFLIKTIA
jgi:hypothetical protein